jgi:dihydroorotate dehydrogenase
VGVNLGKGAKTPVEAAGGDYRALVRTFHPLADYLVVNVSSPNTPRLRRLQDPAALQSLLRDVQAECRSQEAMGARKTPVLVKVAPDLEEAELRGAVEAALAARVDGVIATNTTLGREAVTSRQAVEAGGLSGRPLRRRSTQVLEQLSRLAEGRLTLIGVGGVTDAASAREKLAAGASLVQVLSGLVYRGPGLAAEILRALRSGGAAAPR